jgi:chromosome partitioning protein
MACRRISFLNCKGGVGKTSLVVNLGAVLAKRFNKKVLIVDADSQANSSIWLLGLQRWIKDISTTPARTIYAPFCATPQTLKSAVIKSPILTKDVPSCPSLDLIPSSYDWMEFDHEYREPPLYPYYRTFYDQLQPLTAFYDYILFDCPPALGRASKCAVFASHEIYVPANPDFLSNIGLRLLANKIEHFEQTNQEARSQVSGYRLPEIRGVILNNVDGKSNYDHIRTVIRQLIHNLRVKHVVSDDATILKQEIRRSIHVSKNPLDGGSVPSSIATDEPDVASDYYTLAAYLEANPLKTSERINEITAPLTKTR